MKSKEPADIFWIGIASSIVIYFIWILYKSALNDPYLKQFISIMLGIVFLLYIVICFIIHYSNTDLERKKIDWRNIISIINIFINSLFNKNKNNEQ